MAGHSFVRPQIAEHFAFIAIKGHPVFPGFGDAFVISKNMVAQKKQAAFYRFVFLQKVIVYLAHQQ